MKTNRSIQNHFKVSTSRHVNTNSLLSDWWITKINNNNSKYRQDENKTY